MSVAVELANLQDRVSEFGPLALLVTITPESQPHVVSVAVELTDGVLVTSVGKTTSANVQRVPAVTLVWAAPTDGDYCLLVDGAASLDDAGSGSLAVRPARAVLHRIAHASDTLPSCVTVLDQRPGHTAD